MSKPAQHTMEINRSASIDAFQAKSAADKVLSYMWYIHVLVSVNTEARLRARIAVAIGHSVSPDTCSKSSFIDQRKGPDRQNQPQPFHDLTDHLILWLFSHNVLSRLVDIAPVFAQANGYACILTDIPVFFHEEFCRRLYMLLFSKRIVEWPHGIDVPEPAIAAAEPFIFVDAPVELEDTHLSPELEHEDVGDARLDGAMEDKGESFESPASSYRPAASIWPQTPSLSSWDGNNVAYMERATYFGTVSSPLPMNYFADWDWSREDSSPQGSLDESRMSGARLNTSSLDLHDQSIFPLEKTSR
ncbi:hypothetical protein N0V93_005089 [Gnomoniopsis smithogilvyi]|uniref:Uncharacterized protein n=1 Tax=Gnomoniopsis smithogilvyi TaxID=1191159 RepID=A0A9W9CWE2_9PEZI|nr:hypothetical protein N0V93_005089 [Gnomoniopsis smithogilvyi]